MMAICRSAVERGKVKLPLGRGKPELEALQGALEGSQGSLATVA